MSFRPPRMTLATRGPAGPNVPLPVNFRLPGREFSLVEEAQEYYRRVYSGIRIQTGAAIAIRSDHTVVQDRDVAAPKLNATAMPLTMAGVRDSTSVLQTIMPVADLGLMRAQGHEVGNHTATHVDHPDWPGYWADVAALQQIYVDNNIHCESFIQPGSSTQPYHDIKRLDQVEDPDWWRFFAGNFAMTANYVEDPGIFTNTHSFPARYKYGGRWQVAIEGFSLAAATAIVDEVIARQGFAVLLHHNEELDSTGMTTANYLALLDYIAAKRDADQLDVLTGTGLIYAETGPYINLLADPSFELSRTGALVGWDVSAGAPLITSTVLAHGADPQVAEVTSANVLRKRFPKDFIRTGELLIWARSAVAANATARIEINGGTGGVTYTRDTAVTNTGWTKIRVLFGTQGPSTTSLRIFLRSADANPIWFDDARIIKR